MSSNSETPELKRTLGVFSATAIVAGSMIGSGIFLVTPEAARYVGTEGLLLLLWVLSGILTILGASSYGKLAAHLPEAGGQYVFLREAWGKVPAFLYGWVLLLVIQTGFLAAVSVAFARYVGVLLPVINTTPIAELFPGFTLSTEKLLAAVCLVFLTWINTRGIQYGAMIQNIFTSLKVLALLGLIVLGLAFGSNLWASSSAVSWSLTLPPHADGASLGLMATFAVALVGPLFSSDAWNYVTFIGGEVKSPEKTLPKALTIGTILVVTLYLLANIAYINVLPLEAIQTAADDKVAALMFSTLFGDFGSRAIALIILVSTFGCLNGMVLAGARVFYAMAKDGLLFKQFGHLDPDTKAPDFSLWVQCVWGILLAFSGSYGQLLAYIVFSALVFYIITIAGLLRLAKKIPEAVNMTRKADYIMPMGYIIGASILAAYMLITPDTFCTSIMGVCFTLVGLPVYWLWHKLMPASPASS